MRKVNISKSGYLNVFCPVRGNNQDIDCCTKCAWFRKETSKDDTTTYDIKICFCGEKLIGHIEKDESI